MSKKPKKIFLGLKKQLLGLKSQINNRQQDLCSISGEKYEVPIKKRSTKNLEEMRWNTKFRHFLEKYSKKQ